MIVRPMQNWFRMLFIWNGSVLLSIIPQLIVVAILSSIAAFTHGRVFGEKIPLSPAPFTLFGLTLAIFLAFRNNASYARYTEARLLWGGMLVSSRILVSQTLSYLPQQIRVADYLIAFAYVLKHQLRCTDPTPDLVRYLGAERAAELRRKQYQGAAILNEIRTVLAPGSDAVRWMMDAQVNELQKCLGGCERIASTPIPFAYSVLLHRTVYAYCALLPFALVDSTEFFTPLLCLFISYTLIALEAIANEVAEPFGLAPNALALDAMTRTIERSVLELCGRPLPDEIAPVRPYQLT
jgi:putative membrane protein